MINIGKEIKELGALPLLGSAALCLGVAKYLHNPPKHYYTHSIAEIIFDRYLFFGSMTAGMMLGGLAAYLKSGKVSNETNEGKKAVYHMGHLLGIMNVLALALRAPRLDALCSIPLTGGFYAGITVTHLVKKYG